MKVVSTTGWKVFCGKGALYPGENTASGRGDTILSKVKENTSSSEESSSSFEVFKTSVSVTSVSSLLKLTNSALFLKLVRVFGLEVEAAMRPRNPVGVGVFGFSLTSGIRVENTNRGGVVG